MDTQLRLVNECAALELDMSCISEARHDPRREQVIQSLLETLAYLDQEKLHVAAAHVCSALEILSPRDPRIPMLE